MPLFHEQLELIVWTDRRDKSKGNNLEKEFLVTLSHKKEERWSEGDKPN